MRYDDFTLVECRDLAVGDCFLSRLNHEITMRVEDDHPENNRFVHLTGDNVNVGFAHRQFLDKSVLPVCLLVGADAKNTWECQSINLRRGDIFSFFDSRLAEEVVVLCVAVNIEERSYLVLTGEGQGTFLNPLYVPDKIKMMLIDIKVLVKFDEQQAGRVR